LQRQLFADLMAFNDAAQQLHHVAQPRVNQQLPALTMPYKRAGTRHYVLALKVFRRHHALFGPCCSHRGALRLCVCVGGGSCRVQGLAGCYWLGWRQQQIRLVPLHSSSRPLHCTLKGSNVRAAHYGATVAVSTLVLLVCAGLLLRCRSTSTVSSMLLEL
jgi:hypothetical protein